MLETLFDQTWSNGLESYLTNQPSTGPLETNSQIAALRRDVERFQRRIATCQSNPQLEAAIPGYEDKIAEKDAQIRELEHSLAAEGGPQRPREKFGDNAGAYSIAEAIRGLVSGLQSGDYSDADVLRILNEVGRVLDQHRKPRRGKLYEGPGRSTFGNYELELDIPGLPADVKIVERYDYGGHAKTGRKGPHVQYDLVLWDPVSEKGVKPTPMGPKDPRPLGTGDKDFVSMGQPQEAFGYRIEGTGNSRRIIYLTPKK